MIRITKRNILTMEILSKIPEEVLNNCGMDSLLETSLISDEYFLDQDYVYFELTKDNTIYFMVHGWPGDAPCGFIYRGNEVICELYGNDDPDDDTADETDDFESWYVKRKLKNFLL